MFLFIPVGPIIPARRLGAYGLAMAADRCTQGVVRVVRGGVPTRAELLRPLAYLARYPVPDEPVSGARQLPQPGRLHSDIRVESAARRSPADPGVAASTFG